MLLKKINESPISRHVHNLNTPLKNKLKTKVVNTPFEFFSIVPNTFYKNNKKIQVMFYNDILKITPNIFSKNNLKKDTIKDESLFFLSNINQNTNLNNNNDKKNMNIDHKLSKNMHNNNLYQQIDVECFPVVCYKFNPSFKFLEEHTFPDNNLSLIEQQININNEDNNNVKLSSDFDKDIEPFFIEKLFLEFKRNNAIMKTFNDSIIKNKKNKVIKELEIQNKIDQLKKIITIKNCFFVFRNVTPILYNCTRCPIKNCCHNFDKITLPSNRILLKDITTFLEMMDYPFTSNRHHRETKEFLKDELRINEYTNRYCSNLWLSSYFFNTILQTKKFDIKKFIEKDFFQKYNLSLYLETMFGINIVIE